MTVAELIKALEGVDPSLPVRIYDTENAEVYDVGTVKHVGEELSILLEP